MKRMILISLSSVLLALLLLGSGCKKLLGLERQKNWNFEPVVLDPHINRTAWQFLKDYATGPTRQDSVFYRMYQAIVYSGIDSNLYLQKNKTFIFLHNDAVYRLASNKITADCYFGYHKIGTATGTRWEDYPKDSVKNWLLYLIAEGDHNFGSVGPTPVKAKTLQPPNTYANNPESVIYFSLVNDQNMKFRINDFIGSKVMTQTRAAGFISTNGPVHIVDRVVDYIP